MKTKFWLAICCTIFALSPVVAQEKITEWTPELEERHLRDLQDSTTWDRDMMLFDLGNSYADMPITVGAFPVPDYKRMPGTFHGLAMMTHTVALDNGRTLFCPAFAVRRNALNESRVGEKDNECFCVVAVASDYPLDDENNSDARGIAISRNNPDIVGEGFVRLMQGRVDYVCFITASGDEYAVVNMRLFNLKNGRTILIVPQTDGSLRSMQVCHEKLLELKDIPDHISSILADDETGRFLNCADDGFGWSAGSSE